MKALSRLILLGVWMMHAAACSHADTRVTHTIKVDGNPQQRLIINNLNLSGGQFFDAYMSKDIQQRQLAEMYLAGVLDAGEGKSWCGYNRALPGTIQEVLFMGLKKQLPASMARRASDVINNILASKFPCESKP